VEEPGSEDCWGTLKGEGEGDAAHSKMRLTQESKKSTRLATEIPEKGGRLLERKRDGYGLANLTEGNDVAPESFTLKSSASRHANIDDLWGVRDGRLDEKITKIFPGSRGRRGSKRKGNLGTKPH